MLTPPHHPNLSQNDFFRSSCSFLCCCFLHYKSDDPFSDPAERPRYHLPATTSWTHPPREYFSKHKLLASLPLSAIRDTKFQPQRETIFCRYIPYLPNIRHEGNVPPHEDKHHPLTRRTFSRELVLGIQEASGAQQVNQRTPCSSSLRSTNQMSGHLAQNTFAMSMRVSPRHS